MSNVVEKFKNGRNIQLNKSSGIRKMQTASGGPITYEEDWSDRWEPYAAKIGLAGDVVGLGTAATGIGIPVGTAIAGFANIPNLIIDGYQTARDTWRSFNDNGNSLGSAAWNGGEFILDAAGLKALQYINKAAKAGVASEKYLTSTEKALDSKPWKRVGTGHGRVRARQSADHKRKYNIRRNKALEESNIELAKRGVRPTQGLYYQQKLTDEMAKRGYGVAVNDAIKSANRTIRQNLATISTISGGTNVYHILPRHKNGGLIRKMLTAAGGPLRPISYLDSFEPKWKKEYKKGIQRIPEITVTGKKRYVMSADPDHQTKFIGAMVGPFKNLLSPTQGVRLVYDTGKALSGNMSFTNWSKSLMENNNGIVTDKFAKEHPYLSTGINLVGDAVALGGISGTKKLTNISRPNVNVTADIGTSVEQKMPALSLEEIEKAFNQAKQWHLNRINSPGYKDRALRAGFTEKEVPQLLQLLTRLINSLKLQNKEKLFPNTYSYDDFAGKINAEYWRLPTNKGMFLGIGFYNPNMSYDEAVSKFIHEFGHGATFGLNGNETTGLAGKLSEQFPLITKAVLYNKSLFPEVTEETVKKVFPYAAEPGKLEYYSKPTELLARGYEFMRDYANNWWKLKNSGNSFTNLDAINNAANSRLNSELFRGFTGNLGAYNFQKNALGISVPLGLGGYGLYNNNNLLQRLQYLKQGGKMNILEFLKNGSGIHIKKKNRGKFTSYCGGKVTDECIRKAKASGNPTLVKRATFAANARKWKHLEGGQIKIPKNRTLVRTIKINNGILTAERDSNDNLHWFRNGKYITPNLIKTYKFYDPLLKAYRLLTNYYNEYVDPKTVGTKVYTPNLNIIRAKALKADRQKMLNNINQSVPFNGEKITLRTKGKMNLADIPTNLLDSIAINSGRSNTDFFTNSALVGKESTFGGFSKALGNPIPKEHKEQPWHITNNTAYFNNDYSAYNNAFENNRKPGDKVLLRDEANAKYALEHGLIEGKVPLYSNYVLADAFKRYSLNPSRYNPGQSNYALMVNGIKQELMEEKQFLNYWNTRGKEFYNKGKKETMKKGGIIKGASGFKNTLGQINLFLSSDRGKGLLNFGSSLVTGGLLLNNLNKGKLEYFESEDKNVITKGNEAYKNANVDNEVLQYMSWINSLGDNGGDIVRNYISEKLKNNIRFNAMSEAKAEAEENKKKFMNLYNEASNEIYNNAIKSAFDFASTFANSKNGAPSNDNT